MADVSLFIGGIRPLPESGRPTGMYKSQVSSAEVAREGFVGDQQADRRVHGGPDKAVHFYPAGHYEQLAARFPDARERLHPGAMGENLSSLELDERDVRIGDIWSLGTVRLQVCQPRTPCWKIDERFGCEGIAAFIAEHLLTGWYWRVLELGRVSSGDTLDLSTPAFDAPTLREAMLLWQEHRPSLPDLERLAQTPGLAAGWRDKIHQRLAWLRRAAAG
ncbi:MOSC domain-containing protein [Azoarcus sp. PA01]|nr:MOSC domain-containing protein [Azoarcus sp. PA01]